ncbi:MAG: helicase HerA-like domain-containing protein [Bacteroidota bacterium]
MSNKEKFIQDINKGYTFKGNSIVLGGAMVDKVCQTNSLVKLPLKMLNRHGLIAGATGSGKTKTLQIIAEHLSANSVPVLLMDIKGDLSGIAAASDGHPKIDERHAKIGIPFQADTSPVEFLSLSDEKGARLRATVTEFGPVLFSKILDLTDTQSGIMAVVFKYCDDKGLPLLDLKDLRKTLQWMTGEGKKEVEGEYGRMSTASVGAILRKIVELEQQGAEIFFGERSFDVDDLTRLDKNGKGIVSILRLTDIQDKPKLFSTFMLQMLAEVYASFPEEGDLEQPKLVIFIDEAHLVFDNASKALLDQIEAIVKLIRSKGIGLFFVTQNPADIPDAVLGQLGLKIQHALRAFTAKDRKAIKLSAQNYPDSEYYDVEALLTELGIGEALVTVLNEKGIPTPLVHTLLRAPQSRMDVLIKQEIDAIIKKSAIIKKYNEEIDRKSAYEILNEKIELAQEKEHQEELKKQQEKARKSSSRSRRKEKSTFEKIASSSTGKTIIREVTRGLLGALGIRTSSRRRSKNSWF